MAAPQLPEPVKLFVAVLWREPAALTDAMRQMEQAWGPADFAGPDRPFDLTNYYEPEMGAALLRRIVGFRDLISPESIVEVKLTANQIEDSLCGPFGRLVNLDAGYLDHNKIVLASAKPAGQKIHLARGIYADLVARYAHGRYRPFEWTFLDFEDGRYDEELGELRRRYLEQRKTG
jgi:hypothetical protein